MFSGCLLSSKFKNYSESDIICCGNHLKRNICGCLNVPAAGRHLKLKISNNLDVALSSEYKIKFCIDFTLYIRAWFYNILKKTWFDLRLTEMLLQNLSCRCAFGWSSASVCHARSSALKQVRRFIPCRSASVRHARSSCRAVKNLSL